MNRHIHKYIDEVCGHIKCREAHKEVKDELYDHINELKEQLIADGVSEEGAEFQAVTNMGDSKIIGEQLNKKYKKQTSWSLLALFGAILIFGGVFFYLFARAEALLYVSSYVNFKSYISWVCISLILMILVMFSNYTKINKYAPYLVFGFLILMMLGETFLGNGRYIRIGNLSSFHIANLSSLIIIPVAALIYRAKDKGLPVIFKFGFLTLFIMFMFINMRCASHVLPVGACIVIVFTAAVMKNHFKISRKFYIFIFIIGLMIIACVVIYFINLSPASLRRIGVAFTRGLSDPSGYGYLAVQADYWLGVSKLFGSAEHLEALSHSMVELNYTYILVFIIANLGWVAGIAVILAVSAFIIQLFRIARRIKNGLGFYIALASSTMLAMRFISGVLVNFNLIPSMGAYIPFLSYQGSGYIVDMILLGTLLSVWRYNKIYSRSPEIKAGVVSVVLSRAGKSFLSFPIISTFLKRAGEFLLSLTHEQD